MKYRKKPRFEKDSLRRGFYLLPNLCTALNMFFGFFAIISAINGKYTAASYSILIAGIFDNLDGKIARATRSTSKFGIEFDSLADLISFGMAPALTVYLWALTPLGRIGWLAAFLFVACGGLRLARFNTQVGTVNPNFFLGMPIPAAAGMNAVTVLFCHRLGIADHVHPFIFVAELYVLSFLMVSTIRYPSFKNAVIFRKRNFNVLVASILIFIFIAAQPPIALFLIGLTYVGSGPIFSLRHFIQVRKRSEDAQVGEDQESNSINSIH